MPPETKRTPNAGGLYVETMSDKLFGKFSSYIHERCGIKMPPSKKTMLEGRLRKRLRVLGMSSFNDYYDHVFSEKGTESELVHMMDVVTTNKTEFFRESSHFQYLTEKVLPEWMVKMHPLRKHIRLWSAGCSTGEEPYTLAMVASEFAQEHSSFSFSILATDLSTKVLDKAIGAIYEEEKINWYLENRNYLD